MKRLILCADGTWNVRDQLDENGKRRPTNVTKLARAIRARDAAGIDQVVFYHDGIGTRGPLDTLTGGAFGEGIEANIRNLYRFLVYNYVPGDAIFLFGFSRGAFTVRSLAGFLKQVGLIGKDDDYYVPDLYTCYEQNKGEGTPEWEHAFHRVHVRLPCPPITCIGVWDTVGALGAPGWIGTAASAVGGNKYAYHDVTLQRRDRARLSRPRHRRAPRPVQARSLDAPDRLERHAGTGMVSWRPQQHRRWLHARRACERSAALDRVEGAAPRSRAR